MDRLDRRTFLVGGIRLGTTLAVAGVVVDGAIQASRPGMTGIDDAETASVQRGPGPPTGQTAVGVTNPVGVDPDGVLFGWHTGDQRRGAVQSGYRIVVTGPGDGPTTVWDSGRVTNAAQAFVAYGGPRLTAASRYHWAVSTADANGNWSAPSARAAFVTGLRTSDWEALWLRPGPAELGEEAYTYLRTTKALPKGTIAYATAYVAGAHKYQLWVNGSRVDTGPSFCFPDEQYYQASDVTSSLATGRTNAIGILHHWYGPGRGRPTSAPGLLVQVVVHYVDGNVVTVASDGSWRARPAEWLAAPQRNNDSGDFVEWIDGRLTPTGWSQRRISTTEPGPRLRCWGRWAPLRSPDFSPSAPGSPSSRCRPRHSARLPAARWSSTSARSTPAGPASCSIRGLPAMWYRCMSAIHSTPMVRSPPPTTPRAPTCPSPTFSDPASRPSIPTGTSASVTCRSTTPARPSSASQVDPFRPPRHHARPWRRQRFASSDPMLDAVWELCARSGLYTSQEQFIDTPTREKGQFLWDAANESQTVMRTYGEQNLSWQGLRDMVRAQARYWATTGQVNEVYPNDDGPQDYPTFTAMYPEWVWRYYLSTGDRATVVGLLPNLVRAVGLSGRDRRRFDGTDLRPAACRPTATTNMATTTTPTPIRR